MSLVSIQNVRKSFGAVEVLKGVSVEIGRGDVVAIIGKSGSGKSTLLRCINGLETYDDGDITVDGIEVGESRDNLRDLRRNVGMVFQQFNLFPHLTAAENVMLAPKVVNRENRAQRSPGDRRRRCWPKSACRKRPTAIRRQLSGGQQQRVAIARALAMRPNVLLCDEITSALDPGARQRGAARGRAAGAGGHDADPRHARDAVCPRRRHQAGVHAPGQGARGRSAESSCSQEPGTPELAQFVSTVGAEFSRADGRSTTDRLRS